MIQLESAMGAAIGSIPGARAVHVPRSRFAPVKTTDDLLVVRSDAYELTSDGQMRPCFEDQPPVVTLDASYPGQVRITGPRDVPSGEVLGDQSRCPCRNAEG